MMKTTRLIAELSDVRKKARYVATAKYLGYPTLSAWVEATLDAACCQVVIPPPRWMQKAGFSQRLADCLLNDGLAKEADVAQAFKDRTKAQWVAAPNFGARCYQELYDWMAKRREITHD